VFYCNINIIIWPGVPTQDCNSLFHLEDMLVRTVGPCKIL